MTSPLPPTEHYPTPTTATILAKKYRQNSHKSVLTTVRDGEAKLPRRIGCPGEGPGGLRFPALQRGRTPLQPRARPANHLATPQTRSGSNNTCAKKKSGNFQRRPRPAKGRPEEGHTTSEGLRREAQTREP